MIKIVSIELVSLENKQEIFEFEKENREYFSSLHIGRVPSYFNPYSFDRIINSILAEAEEGLAYLYIIRSPQGELIGRLNLYDIIRGDFQVCQLGYRIGKDHQKKGYATLAVKLAINQAFNEYDLHRIEANTTLENLASQKVLENNNFRRIGLAEEYIKVNNIWEDFYLYELINKKP